jgi:transcriptional regulator with XRE-family HTH domain
VPAKRTQARFAQALPVALREQGLSLRELARRLGIDASYLARIRDGKVHMRPDLPGRVAQALELPVDFFLETREQKVFAALREDPQLLDRLYGRIVAQER